MLLRTRPDTGLLGGMTEVPTTHWAPISTTRARSTTAPSFARARSTRWRRVPGVVTHVFTHFPLELAVFIARGAGADAPRRTGMRWVALADVAGEALPNVMRKVVAHALPPNSAKPSHAATVSKTPLRGVKAR